VRNVMGSLLQVAVLLVAAPPGLWAQVATVKCASKPGEQQHCAADTSGGVAIARSTGEAECLLGKTWGYDDAGVWVKDGCAGEFVLGQAVPRGAEAPAPPATEGENAHSAAPQKRTPSSRIESWGDFEPGEGFLVGRSSVGELSISAYALVRWIDQTPAGQTFTDHLGNTHPVDARNDIFAHRAMLFVKGWLGTPKLIYTVLFWTVNTTDQKGIFPILGYQFGRKFSLYAGLNGLPGTRSIQGSHPYWLAPDRVMTDEFFRPYFTNAVWAQGEVLPGLWYNAVLGNNSSSLGIKATELDRKFTYGGSVFWMPTTHEFGPRGAYGDWEGHEKVATRFGIGAVKSPENRQTTSDTAPPNNTTLRLADSLNVFDEGSLAPGVSVLSVDYRVLDRRRGQVPWVLPAGRVLQPLARQVPVGRTPPGRPHPRPGLLPAGGLLPGAEEARALRRDVAGLRRQGGRVRRQQRVPGRGQLLSHELAQPPGQRPGHPRGRLAGEQHVRLLRGRPERYDAVAGRLGLLLSEE